MLASDQTNELVNQLEAGAKQLGIELNQLNSHALVSFLQLLSKWNRVYNLTAVRNIHDMVGRHVLDSLSVLPWLPESPDSVSSNTNGDRVDVLDVGTGAGLPVIPLAILRPDLRFMSVESNGKKTRFQQQAIVELDLSNVTVKQARIEDVHAQANTIVSRAFSAPETFLKAIDKNCVDKSRVVIMLGLKEKMPEHLPNQFSLKRVQQVDIPQCEALRHIAVCDKQ